MPPETIGPRMADRAPSSSDPVDPAPLSDSGPSPGNEPTAEVVRVVGIGSSAGGLEALERLIDHLPTDSGMAFVVVTHQNPDHESMLATLLGRDTTMPVLEASDGIAVEPDHIYVDPPGGQLSIQEGRLIRSGVDEPRASRHPIDAFFDSLASDRGRGAIAIVLSGTGRDGTAGIRSIRACGGVTVAQLPSSARYAGMPESAIASGCIDHVLPPEEIPALLIASCARRPEDRRSASDDHVFADDPEALGRVFRILEDRTGHDFSSYKTSTILRRIARRLDAHKIDEPLHYIQYLEEHPEEIDVLFRELLISVTSFFRDPDMFRELGTRILPDALADRDAGAPFRVWCPGCATGEEAYSIAIELRECMASLARPPPVQIFGTDLDPVAIEFARAGRYPASIEADLTLERAERHFVRTAQELRVRKDVRELVVFAPQNIMKDPPFTHLDLLSCRNLLIYLDPVFQRRLFPIFHYALKPGGILILGPSESTGGLGDLFEVLDHRWKIYRRTELSADRRQLPDMPAGFTDRTRGRRTPELPTRSSPRSLALLIEKKLLSQLCPACVVVNDQGEIVHVHGRTGEYLELAEGTPRAHVLDMAREGLRHELAELLRRAAEGRDPAVRKRIHAQTSNGVVAVDLSARRWSDPPPLRDLTAISFGPVPLDTRIPPVVVSTDLESRETRKLHEQLRDLEESRQSTLEQLEYSNEDLRSANEELQSINEEFQSANEELESSKEEMQSLNEELSTVNSELHLKVESLSQANDDMQNLLESTQIATLFLDNDLCILRFTDPAKKVFRLRPVDVGRPLGDLASTVQPDNLVMNCRRVLDTLVPHETEVRAREGAWYQMRIMPYRTAENRIAGLVITFVEIERIQEARGTISRAQVEAIVNTIREPLLILDGDLCVVSCNRAFRRTFEVNEEQTRGAHFLDLGSAEWDADQVQQLLEEVLPRNGEFEDFRITARFPRSGDRTFLLNARSLQGEPGRPSETLVVFQELPRRRGTEPSE